MECQRQTTETRADNNETTKMFFEAMRKFVDAIQVNAPIGGGFAVIGLTELETVVKIGVLIVSAICTVLITRYKLKQKDKSDD